MSNKMSRKCVYCMTKIKKVFVKCKQCSDDMILCLECFSNGVELGKHVNRHDYSVESAIENKVANLSLFSDGWSYEEEDVLLDAVEHFGFGSWYDVANFVKTRNKRECENHYLRYYVQGSIGEVTLGSEPAMTCGEEYAGSILVNQGKFQELTVSQQQELGYMALRDDFERDYDNEAEVALSGASLHYMDTPADVAYKVFQVEVYRERQKGRELRKVVAKNFGVLHDATSHGFRSYCVARKKRTRELKLFQSRFMPFAKFMDGNSFLRLFSDINRQARLMNHLKTLLKLNRKGHKKLTGNFKRINGYLNGDKKRRKKSSKCYK